METRARQLGHMTARMVCGFICVLLMSRFMFYCGFTCVLFMMSFRCVYDSLVFAFMLRLRCFMLVLYVFGLCKALSLRSGSYRRSPLGLPKDTVIQAISCLSAMYDLLSNYTRSEMRHAAGRLALLLAALRDASEDPLWRMKPKVHLMLHLAENLHSPAETWTYRDEDYGGSAARSMRSRGGTDTPKVAGENLLQKFCCRHDLPTALGIGKCDCSAPAFHSLLGVV